MFTSIGQLTYHDGWRSVLDIDEGLAEYYRNQIPRTIAFNKPFYNSHITVVRGKYETPINKDIWGKYEGDIIEFKYDHSLRIDETYIWIKVECKRLESIRLELGLNNCYDRFKGFHITVANRKNI